MIEDEGVCGVQRGCEEVCVSSSGRNKAFLSYNSVRETSYVTGPTSRTTPSLHSFNMQRILLALLAFATYVAACDTAYNYCHC